jgi:predicted transposase YdaD
MRFDATAKELLEESPPAWPAFVGEPAKDVDVVDASISTVTGAADKVLRIRDEPQWIHHVEFQTGPDASLPRRINVYNAVLEDRHGLPVRSTVVLLRRDAHLAAINGRYECRWPRAAEPYRVFRYDVIRVWELPPERFLGGGLGLVPLAPISAVAEARLPDVLRRMKERFVREAPRSHLGKLWTATYVLMGLRFQESLISNLLEEVIGMEDSVTYQAIIRKGEQKGTIKGMRDVLLLVGQEQFGKPRARVKAAIEALEDPAELQRLSVRLLHVKSWAELLSLPSKTGRRKG